MCVDNSFNQWGTGWSQKIKTITSDIVMVSRGKARAASKVKSTKLEICNPPPLPYGGPTTTPSRLRTRGRRVGGRSGRRRFRLPPQPPVFRPPPPLHHLSPPPLPPAHPWARLRRPGRDAPPLPLIFRPRGSRGRPDRRHRLQARLVAPGAAGPR